MILRYGLLVSSLLLVNTSFAQDVPALGKISFPTSATPVAEKDFVIGVLYLHSFVYDRARAAFQKAEAEDPSFALAYWGEAMTYNQPLWNQFDLAAARQALDKLAPTDDGRMTKAKTPREKGFIHAINLLYGKGNKAVRDAAYSEAMCQLYRQFPNDDEVGAFYALSLLGTEEGNRNYQTDMQAAGIVEEILQHNPQHPGALHYSIHAYDDPVHAPLGLRAARAYAKIAPDAPHALHMPSHIYLALGMWDGVVNSNKAAWAAGIKNNPSGNPANFGIHDLHALEWLVYGYLQKRQYQEAYDLVKTMQNIVEKSPTPLAKFHYALMRGDYFTESGNWSADLKPMPMDEMEPASYATEVYTNALVDLHKAHQDANLAQNLAILDKLSKMAPSKVDPLHHGDYYTVASPTGIMIAEIIHLQLQAQINVQQGKFKEAISLLQQASQLEDKLRIGYGPPVPVKPSHELLADVYFLNKQYVNAYNEYVKELKLAPNRTLAKEGLQRATEKIKAEGLPVPKGITPYFNRLMGEEQTT